MGEGEAKRVSTSAGGAILNGERDGGGSSARATLSLSLSLSLPCTHTHLLAGRGGDADGGAV